MRACGAVLICACWSALRFYNSPFSSAPFFSAAAS